MFDMADIRTTLRGTGVAVVTPFTSDEKIDFTALEKVINSIIENGVEYVVTMGTTGETPTLSKEEKKDIINFTFEKVNGRVPVVVGIGGNNTTRFDKRFANLSIRKSNGCFKCFSLL